MVALLVITYPTAMKWKCDLMNESAWHMDSNVTHSAIQQFVVCFWNIHRIISTQMTDRCCSFDNVQIQVTESKCSSVREVVANLVNSSKSWVWVSGYSILFKKRTLSCIAVLHKKYNDQGTESLWSWTESWTFLMGMGSTCRLTKTVSVQ